MEGFPKWRCLSYSQITTPSQKHTPIIWHSPVTQYSKLGGITGYQNHEAQGHHLLKLMLTGPSFVRWFSKYLIFISVYNNWFMCKVIISSFFMLVYMQSCHIRVLDFDCIPDLEVLLLENWSSFASVMFIWQTCWRHNPSCVTSIQLSAVI